MSERRRSGVGAKPTNELERDLLGRFGPVVGMDEVGRGAIAGPLAVGAVLIDANCGQAPEGLADSKLIPEALREGMVDPVRRWCIASAVGWATPREITALGITDALRIAGLRALRVVSLSSRVVPQCVLLDGKHNWLKPPEDTLFQVADEDPEQVGDLEVITRVKADMTSQVVAAASIVAKVARDRYMSALPDPGYHWRTNKGYATASHTAGLRELGPGRFHRLGWNLPGVSKGQK